MKSFRRGSTPLVYPIQNRNIGRQYAIQSASWIWHPDHLHDEPQFLRFRAEISVPEPCSVRFHVSADERYELSIDGTWVAIGPDRGDVLHWQFASYEVELEAGGHVFEATCWYLGERLRPTAQVSWRPGFIFMAEGPLGDQLTTGRGVWRVVELAGIRCEDARMLKMPGLLCVGPAFRIDGTAFADPGSEAPDDWVDAAVVLPPVTEPQLWGVTYPGWALLPSPLPQQTLTGRRIGTVRAVRSGSEFDSVEPFSDADEAHGDIVRWQAMLDGAGPRPDLTVAAGASLEVIIDLGDYYCGYAVPVLGGGEGGTLSVEWAESLYARLDRPVDKADRDEVAGKRFLGFHDTFVHDGSPSRAYRAFWWRAGRYVRLWMRAGREPLTIREITIVESRYPLESVAQYESSDPAHQKIHSIGVRGIQCSLHETYTDSPYYEQMMYVGDTRLETLVTHRLTADDRPQRMAIDWFDRSRYRDGFTSERYPTDAWQQCLPFSMIWILMIRDYALYKDDAHYVREKLTGVRQSLEAFRGLMGRNVLLEAIPGWPWMDWPAEWRNGTPPDSRTGASSVINMLFVNALVAAADLEDWFGEATMAARNRDLARKVFQRTIAEFWNPEVRLLADDRGHVCYSEHGMSLALLTGLLDGSLQAALVKGLETSVARAFPRDAAALGIQPDERTPDIVRTTVYFSFYLHEALLAAGRRDLYELELNRWRTLVRLGLKTPIEDDSRPSARSDCHAWGAHPLHMFHGRFAGVLPGEPGYRSVRIAPMPGGLTHVRSRTPHPRGVVEVDLEFSGAHCHATVSLPASTPGTFVWGGHVRHLDGGTVSVFDLDETNLNTVQ